MVSEKKLKFKATPLLKVKCLTGVNICEPDGRGAPPALCNGMLFIPHSAQSRTVSLYRKFPSKTRKKVIAKKQSYKLIKYKNEEMEMYQISLTRMEFSRLKLRSSCLKSLQLMKIDQKMMYANSSIANRLSTVTNQIVLYSCIILINA